MSSLGITQSNFILLLENNICTTPSKSQGACVPLQSCAVLNELKRDQKNIRLIQKSKCGTEENPFVCCPSDLAPPIAIMKLPVKPTGTNKGPNVTCEDPEGVMGLCVLPRYCPAIANMIDIKPAPPKNVFNFILASKASCDPVSNGTYLFCCANPITKPKLPEAGVCGVGLQDKIVGGKVAKFDEFPWTALLFYDTKRNREIKREYLCGGNLINERYVLTGTP